MNKYLSPVENFLISASKTELNNDAFILTIWINGCYSKYPANIASMEHIRKYYTDQYEINKLIDQKFPSQIINILKQNNNKFELLCHGYLRQINTKYITPNDIINMINKICIVKCFDDLHREGMIILTNIITSNSLNTKQFNNLFNKGIINILMKSVYKTSFRLVSLVAWCLKYIAENLKNQLSISIYENQMHQCIKIIRQKYGTPSLNSIPSVDELIESKILTLLRNLLLQNTCLSLQHESLWTLLNISACDSEYVEMITSSNVYLETLISLLKSPYYQIKGDVLWTLGNIAGDGIESKELLLNKNILSNILPICQSKYNKKYVTNFNDEKIIIINPKYQFADLLSICAWTVSNFCDGFPTNISHLYDAIKCLHYLYKQSLLMDDNIGTGTKKSSIGKKNEIIKEVAWGFGYLAASDRYKSESINKMDELGILKQFVELMDHKYEAVRHPVNRLIGNILTGSDEYACKCLDLGILNKYKIILTNLQTETYSTEKREICWSLSNVCCTNQNKHKLFVMKHGLFKILINYLQNYDFATSMEAVWAISNAVTKRNKAIINHLIENNIHHALMTFLRKYETNCTKNKNKILFVALECIENILISGKQYQSSGDTINKFSCLFEESGIVSFLENLQTDEQTKKDIDVNMIKKYFQKQEQ